MATEADNVTLPGWDAAVEKAVADGKDPQDFAMVARFLREGTAGDDLLLGMALTQTRPFLMGNSRLSDAINRALGRHAAAAKQAFRDQLLASENREPGDRDYLRDPATARLVYALVTLNEGLIHQEVSRHVTFATDLYDDLVSIGRGVSGSLSSKPDGLIYAALHYDPDRRFSTFAVTAIKNAFHTHWRRTARHDVLRPGFADGLTPDMEPAAPEPAEPADEEHVTPQILQAVAEALKRIPNPRGRTILQHTFQAVLAGESPNTLEEMGRDWGISKERVRQIRDKAWGKFIQELRDIAPELAEGVSEHYPKFGRRNHPGNGREIA